MVQELSLASEQLSTENERTEMVEASLAAKSTCLDESIVECAELHRLLAEE